MAWLKTHRIDFPRPTIAALLAFTGALTVSAAATPVDMELRTAPGPYSVCDIVEIDLVVSAPQPGQAFDSVDAILNWDPAVLEYVGIDADSIGEEFFIWGFLPDIDQINNDLTDGDGIFTALVSPGQTVTAPLAPTTLTLATLQFRLRAPATATPVALVAEMGAFAETRVLLNGATFTGALGAPATVTGGTTLGDIDESGSVGFIDLLIVLSSWGTCEGCCPADLDGDGIVGFEDLLLVLSLWG